jgi:hypothetical protein
MSNGLDYMFNNLSNIGNDSYSYTERNKINNKQSDYKLNNLFNTNCGINNDLMKATSMPNVFFTGSTQIGPNGCNVDIYSELLKGKRKDDATMLQQRTFLSVPYLGKGNCNVLMESRIQQGDTFKEKKSEMKLSENTEFLVENYPLDRKLKEKVNDSSHFIEDDAAKGWIRGGVSTREIYKEKSYNLSGNVKRESLMD